MNDGPFVKYLWPILASLAGAVTALSFKPFQTMKRSEIFMALFVGTSFAFFVSPLVINAMARGGDEDARVAGAIIYILAAGSNFLIVPAIKKIGVIVGYRDPEEKP